MPEPNNLDRWAREVVEQSKGSVWSGLGVTLVLHMLVQVAAFFILVTIVSGERGLELAILPLGYIGVSQLVYMIPAILIFRRRGDAETAKGLIVGGSITFLLNATCNGLYFLTG
jgi:hypothetical protein